MLQFAVAHIEDDPSTAGLTPDYVVDALAMGLDLRREPKPVQHIQSCRLEHQAGTDGARRVETFVDQDTPPLPGQHEGDGKAGWTGTDDGNVVPGSQAARR
jgi:hypothetical protein